MDTYKADTFTVDLMNISSTGCTLDPCYGAVPPVTITTTTGAGRPAITWPSTAEWPFTVPGQITQLSGKLSLSGEDADIEINGESVVSMLKEIRDRLNILQVSKDMEAEWDELRELRERYEAKLAECKAKSDAWAALKQAG